VEHGLVGASTFPRHWVYGADGRISQKSGIIDFGEWANHSFGKHTPWGDEESPALVAAVETALERQLSLEIMREDVTSVDVDLGQLGVASGVPVQ
jgi:hypothetical protein